MLAAHSVRARLLSVAASCLVFVATTGDAQTASTNPQSEPQKQTPPAPAAPPAQAQTLGEQNLFFYDDGFPPEAVKQRHSGTVLIRAAVAANGRFVDAAIENSSGSTILDEAAIRYANGLGFRADAPAENRPTAVLVPVRFVLDSTSTLVAKTCAEFTNDYAQFRTLKPNNQTGDMPVFTLATGIVVAKGSVDFSRLTKLGAAREKTVETCGKSPNKKFLDVYEKSLR